MRKFLLVLLTVVAFAFMVTPAMAVVTNQWDWDTDSDTTGADGLIYMVTGEQLEGSEESVAGYAEDGIAADTYYPNSRVYFDTDAPLSTPLYSVPCPQAQLLMTCEYVARDPQTEDKGVAMQEDEGIILDDLFTWVEDYSDQATNTQRHIAQALDILFYNRSSLSGDTDAVAPDGETYPIGLGISQTLDQDLADFQGTVGGNGNGIAGVIWQNFNLMKLGLTLHTEDAGGEDLWNSAKGWLDQVIYAYVGDIEGVSGANGTQGIKQSYLSKKIIVGAGGGCIIPAGCTIEENQGHDDVTITGSLQNVNHLDKDISHVTKPTMEDP